MKSMITGYRHLTGEHCGSTAMRNMMFHYCGIDLSEAFTFGLGSGIEFLFIRNMGSDPEAFIFGRSATLEIDLAEALGIDYREQPVFENEKAWQLIRNEILQSRPAIICTDVFYMDHKEYKVHFPFNRFVVVGFDDENEKAYIYDRYCETPQTVSLKAMALARNPAEYPIYNLWGKFHSDQAEKSLKDACAYALKRTALRMTGQDNTTKNLLQALFKGRSATFDTGLAGLNAFKNEFSSWRQKKNHEWLLSYAAQTIEKFGTGGGNFRKLFAGFIAEAKELLPDIIDLELVSQTKKNGDKWTALSQSLTRLSEEDTDQQWKAVEAIIEEIIGLETLIFTAIRNKFDN